MKTFLPGCRCVECGQLIDGATGIVDSETSPNPGDVTICVYCGRIMVFCLRHEHLGVREPTRAEWTEIMTNLSWVFDIQRTIIKNPKKIWKKNPKRKQK